MFSFLTNEAAPGTEKEGPICIYKFIISKFLLQFRCYMISIVKSVSKLGGTSKPLEMPSAASSWFNPNLRWERMQSLPCLILILIQISFFLPRQKLSLALAKINRLIFLLMLSYLLHQRYHLALNRWHKLHIFSFFSVSSFYCIIYFHGRKEVLE